MALRKFRPMTPSTRGLVLVDKSELWKGRPVKSLSKGKAKTGGRKQQGAHHRSPSRVAGTNAYPHD